MEKVKVGILLNSRYVRMWEYRVLQRISESGFSELSLVVFSRGNKGTAGSEKEPFIIRLHDRLDRFFFRRKFDYDRVKDISSLIGGLPSVSLAVAGGFGFSDNEGNKEITGKADVIINFGGHLPESIPLEVPRYGIWSFITDSSRVILGLLAEDLKAVKDSYGIIGAVIKMLDNEGHNKIIYRAQASLYPSSLNVTRDQIYGLAPLIIPRLLERLSTGGASFLDNLMKEQTKPIDTHGIRIYTPPTGFGNVNNLLAIFKKYFLKKVINLNPDPWSILYSLSEGGCYNEKLNSFRELRGPSGTFWADPFIVTRDGRSYIFIEEYVYKKYKGHLSVIELDENGNFLGSEKILEKPYHLSYPFVFELDNQFYLIPESLEDKKISLYRSMEFPYKWEFAASIMENVSATDPTLIFHDGLWWLFVSIDRTGLKTDCFNELFLYFTDDLFSGRWQSHPLNPVVTDPHNSRSAGKIFFENGKIYRPAQDCFWRYGNALNINHITKLSTAEYAENLVSKIKPTFGERFIGVHTFNFNSSVTVLDVVSRSRRFNLFRSEKRDVNATYNAGPCVENETRRTKILFFIDGLTSGGKERRLTELMKELRLRPDFDFQIVLMNRNVHYKVVFDLGIDIHYFIRKTRKDMSVFSQFYKLCRSYRPDIVHCWDSMTAVYSLPACKLLKIKLINGMVVDTPVRQNILNKNWLRARITFPLTDMVVGNSRAGLKAYSAPEGRSVCIYNGMDLTRFMKTRDHNEVKREIFGCDPGEIFIVGMVAAFEARKDYRTLIRTAVRLLTTKPDMRFILVGAGSNLEPMKAEVPEEMRDKILFPGGRADVESIVNIFDVGVLLTNAKVHGEGISNSVIEYMALNKPVIATRGGGTDEVVFDNKTGFLIESEDSDQLADRINVFYNDRQLRSEMGANGRKMVEETFDAKIMTKHYVELYRKITWLTSLVITWEPIQTITSCLNTIVE